MKYVDLQKIKKKTNLEEYFNQVPRFEVMKQELFQDDINSHQLTICLDIENVLVRQVNILDIDEMNSLKEI